MAERIGFIGLGKMGTSLTRNLLEDGHEVAGYDIDPARMKTLEDAGGTPLPSAREVAERSDVVFTILLKPEHIEENTIGDKGIAAAGKEGLILVEMSTMHPTWSKGLSEKLAARETPTNSATTCSGAFRKRKSSLTAGKWKFPWSPTVPSPWAF